MKTFDLRVMALGFTAAVRVMAARVRNASLRTVVWLAAGTSLLTFSLGAYGVASLERLGGHVDGALLQPVLLSMLVLVALGAVVAPLLCVLFWWLSRERLETAALAARMTLTRCESAHRAIADQTQRGLSDLENQRRLLTSVLADYDRGGTVAGPDTRRQLLAVEHSLRTRLSALSQLPVQASQIADSVKMLGVLLSSPNALPKVGRLVGESVASPGASAYRTVKVVVG